jgi:hypothetical protein
VSAEQGDTVRTGQDRTGQDRTGQDRKGQDTAKQDIVITTVEQDENRILIP